MHGRFVWADLSTHDHDTAQRFYKALLGWRMVNQAGYSFCYAGRHQTAGLYPMPDFFKSINMPSFWMPYILVDDVAETAGLAESLGGKVEIRDEQFGDDARIALLRDPLGAGFTVYQGPALAGRRQTSNCFAWNEMVVSDVSRVKPFYETLFGWTITPAASPYRFDVAHADGTHIAAIEQVGNAIKGREEFWSVYFTVDDLAASCKRVVELGGTVVDGPHDGVAMVVDAQSAVFMLMQSDTDGAGAGEIAQSSSVTQWKWRSLLGLMLVYVAIAFDWSWVWGILFLLWVLPDLRSGSTYFVEQVTRRDNPVLYWAIVGTWLGLAIWTIGTAFI